MSCSGWTTSRNNQPCTWGGGGAVAARTRDDGGDDGGEGPSATRAYVVRHRRKLATLEAENNIDDNVSCPNEFMLEQHVKSDRRKRQVAAVNVMSDSTGISMLTGSNSSFVGNHPPSRS